MGGVKEGQRRTGKEGCAGIYRVSSIIEFQQGEQRRDTGFNHLSVETLAEHFLKAGKALPAAGGRMDGKRQWMQAILLESLAVKGVGFVFRLLTFYSFIARLEKIAYFYERKVPIEAECRDKLGE